MANTPNARAGSGSSGWCARVRARAGTRASSSPGSASTGSRSARDTRRASQAKVIGYSVRLAGSEHDHGQAVWYGGGRLARDLTLPALRRSWHQPPEEERRAVDQWRSGGVAGSRSPAGRHAELEQRGLLWHRCTTEIECVRLQLRAVGTDPTACAHAAREGAAVLAAWSLDLEGQEPGPLARASRQLARSAELPAYTPAPRQPLSRASGLALFMLAAGRPDSAVGWLLVCRELGLLAGEIGRVHRARGELDRAREIETDLHAELEAIRTRIDPGRPESVELDAEAEAARRAREPLGAATRQAPERSCGRRRRRRGQAADRSDPPAPAAATVTHGSGVRPSAVWTPVSRRTAHRFDAAVAQASV